MKLERKNSKRYQHQKAFLDMSLKENQHPLPAAVRSTKHSLNKTLPSYLQDIKNKFEDENSQRQVRFKPTLNRVKSPLKKSPNSRGLFKTNSLSNLNHNEHHSSPKKTQKSPRASKPTTTSLSSSARRNAKTKSESMSCDKDNSENRPLSAVAANLDQPLNISRAHRNNTLNEKSINCLLSDLIDQTSSNLGCLASKNYTPKQEEALLANTLPTSHLNSSQSRPSTVEKNVQVKEAETTHQSVPKNSQKSPSKLKTKPEVLNVIVPSYRVKNFTMRYRIEGTENLNEETFNKRHQKLENEEIKMQRWDMKRQRDEYEKSIRMFKSELKGKKNQTKSKSSEVNKPSSSQIETKVEALSEEFTLEESEMYIIRVVGDISELSQPELQYPSETLEPKANKQPEKKMSKAVGASQKVDKKQINQKENKTKSTVGKVTMSESRKTKRKREVRQIDTSPVKESPVKKMRTQQNRRPSLPLGS